jgi:galactokinase
MRSENFGEQIEIALDDPAPRDPHHWSAYVVGVAKILEATGRSLRGGNLLIHGNVPQGAGLSSSASLEVAVGAALLDLAGYIVPAKELALLCQRAENEFVGARCGIMDQFVAVHGKRGQALLLDCRSLEHRLLRLPEQVRVVICNSMVRHSVAGGEYNQRRAECEEGVRSLAPHVPNMKALRDITMAELSAHQLPKIVEKRCRHVVSENERVVQAASALEQGDLEEFGSLMRRSHESLRDDFEVSCPELDLLVELASGIEGVYGARMTGGGFGGCTVNLVRAEFVKQFEAEVRNRYEQGMGKTPEIYVCAATDGVSRIA